MLKYYKPNKNNTGSACSFSYNKRDKALWVNFVRQSSPDKSAPFKGSGPEKKASSKLNPKELAGLVRAIETNGEYGNFHSTPKGTTSYKFGPYVKDGEQLGHSFSLNQNSTENDSKKSFVMGFDFAEGWLLKQYLQTVLSGYCVDCIDENQFGSDHPSSNKKTEEKVETPAPAEDNKQDVDLDIPW